MDKLQDMVVMDTCSSINEGSDSCSLHVYLNQHMDI